MRNWRSPRRAKDGGPKGLVALFGQVEPRRAARAKLSWLGLSRAKFSAKKGRGLIIWLSRALSERINSERASEQHKHDNRCRPISRARSPAKSRAASNDIFQSSLRDYW